MRDLNMESQKIKVKHFTDKGNFLFVIFPGLHLYNLKSNTKYLFLSQASSIFRFNIFLNYFTRHGKKFKSLSFFFNFLTILKFKLKCKNILFLINAVFSNLEPFFALRQVRRRGKLFIIPVLNTIKSRASIACEFFFQSLLELKKKNIRVSLTRIALREVVLLLRNKRPLAVQKLEKYNFILRQNHLKVKNFKHDSKFPKDFRF